MQNSQMFLVICIYGLNGVFCPSSPKEKVLGGPPTTDYSKGIGECVTEGPAFQTLPGVPSAAQDQARPARQHQGSGHVTSKDYADQKSEEDG